MAADVHPDLPPGFAAGFVTALLDQALARETRVLGVSGLQGSGKSTLATQLVAMATGRGLRAVALSIDDVYLDQPQRRQLAREVHPLLATRGPPGTHDIGLALDTLDGLRTGRATALPRFDKLDDRRLPASRWPTVQGIDLVVFEGWFLGTPAEHAAALVEPVNALERDEDPEGTWRRHCNDALARDYPALWVRIDRLLFLQPPDFEIVNRWRWQQEQSLQQTDPSRRAMTRGEVERFVLHFERTSRQALRTLPTLADHVVRLDATRRPVE